MKRKLLYPFLMAVSLFTTGCGNRTSKQSEVKAPASDNLIDASGRTVTIPAVVNRVVSPFTMYTRLIVAMGGCNKLVGVSHSCVLPEEERGCAGSLLALPDVGDFGANTELIASLAPDLIFVSQPDVAAFASKTRATVVSISFPSDVPMLDIFNLQIDLIGKALRLQENADSLKKFIADVVHPVISVTSSLPDSARPKVYFAWTSWTGDILNTVSEFDPIELGGGINVARDAKNFAKGQRGILVSREHILKWNPDFIFISRYQQQKWNKQGQTKALPVTINDVLNDPLMQSVNAIKYRRVYYTTAFCNWWPQQRALVQILYMAKLFHPQLFKDLDVRKEGDRIFKRFYGTDSLYTAIAHELELVSDR